MKIMNMFGGPGSGKSTVAAGLFHRMKIDGYNVELVTEYAKEMTWEGRHNILTDQLYILAKQNRKIQRLDGKVDYVITDSPVIMGIVYTDPNYHPSYFTLIEEIFKSYDNYNFFLNRPWDYSEVGRNQTIEEAVLLDQDIHTMLDNLEIDYKILETEDPDLFSRIIDKV